MMEDMYSNTQYGCKLYPFISEPFMTNRGVKQGDNLSPLLFNSFVDDFEDTLLNTVYLDLPSLNNIPVGHMFFADDLVLASATPEGL
jgi:hypothetical protein